MGIAHIGMAGLGLIALHAPPIPSINYPEASKTTCTHTNSQDSNNPPSHTESLPTYTSLSPIIPPPQKSSKTQAPAEDVLYFLDHRTDTLASLSFRYTVPVVPVLRRANNVTSDHLLLARRTVVRPGEFYKRGVSMSARPVEGEDEERRKAVVRSWMVACKVAEYAIPCSCLLEAEVREIGRGTERWGLRR